MLVNANELLRKASKEGYAIPAYNINNMEWIKYILEACQADKSPVILAVTLGTIKYFGGYKVVFNVVNSLIKSLNITVPVVLHLDHAHNFNECKMAIDSGFTSVMFDGSSLDFETNVKITNEVIEYAKAHNVSVEAELGSLAGEGHTDLQEAQWFVSQTNVDFLAPSIGNRHGFYHGEVKLDFDLLGAICKAVKVPLVLHGASFLDENKIKTAIFCGVAKININTDLQYSWSLKVKEYLKTNPDVYDPRLIISSGEETIKNRVRYNNNLFGSKNHEN